MDKLRTGQETPLAEHVAREYEAMVRAIEALEHALSSPAPTREAEWRMQARRDLAKVIGLLQEHCELAESDGGLHREVERGLGRSRALSEAQQEHEPLQRDAVALLAAIDSDKAAAAGSYHQLRERAWDLTARVRRHQAHEADLLIELLERDTGASD